MTGMTCDEHRAPAPCRLGSSASGWSQALNLLAQHPESGTLRVGSTMAACPFASKYDGKIGGMEMP